MDTGTIRAGQREARVLGGLVAVIVATGLAGSLFPAAKTTITAVIAVGVLALVARLSWWRVRERRADSADAVAAAAARAAYAARSRQFREVA
jgi:predicted lipid-binding transport protein (Tim44 family)